MDPIGDMLTRIRNAKTAHHLTVSIPHSKMKTAILKILKKENFIKDFEKKGKKTRKSIMVTLRYHKDGTPVITDVRRISKPGRRVYKGANELHLIKEGFGMAVVSTPDGLLTNAEARRKKVGGEIICEIW